MKIKMNENDERIVQEYLSKKAQDDKLAELYATTANEIEGLVGQQESLKAALGDLEKEILKSLGALEMIVTMIKLDSE